MPSSLNSWDKLHPIHPPAQIDVLDDLSPKPSNSSPPSSFVYVHSPCENIVARVYENGLLELVLFRPKALNSLTLEMIEAFTYFIDKVNTYVSGNLSDIKPDVFSELPADLSLASSGVDVSCIPSFPAPSIACILITSCFSKAYCAGGDVVKITQSSNLSYAQKFFAFEYFLHQKIIHSAVPIIAFLRGFVMGGGVGMSIHNHIRIATDSVQYAMPETNIGYFPDIAATYFLPRFRSELGLYMALTSSRLAVGDVIRSGIATHYLPDSMIAEFLAMMRTVALHPVNTAKSQVRCVDRLSHITDVISSFCFDTYDIEQQSSDLMSYDGVPYYSFSDELATKNCFFFYAVCRYLHIDIKSRLYLTKEDVLAVESRKKIRAQSQSSSLPQRNLPVLPKGSLTSDYLIFIQAVFSSDSYHELIERLDLWTQLAPTLQTSSLSSSPSTHPVLLSRCLEMIQHPSSPVVSQLEKWCELAKNSRFILSGLSPASVILAFQLYRLGKRYLDTVQETIVLEMRAVMRMTIGAFNNDNFSRGVKARLVTKQKDPPSWTDFDLVLREMLMRDPEWKNSIQRALGAVPHVHLTPSLSMNTVAQEYSNAKAISEAESTGSERDSDGNEENPRIYQEPTFMFPDHVESRHHRNYGDYSTTSPCSSSSSISNEKDIDAQLAKWKPEEKEQVYLYYYVRPFGPCHNPEEVNLQELIPYERFLASVHLDFDAFNNIETEKLGKTGREPSVKSSL